MWIPGTTVGLMAEVQLDLLVVTPGCVTTRTRRARQLLWSDEGLPIRYGRLPAGYEPVLHPETYTYGPTGWHTGACPGL